MRVAVLRAGHRLDDAARVVRVVVAVVADACLPAQVAGEEAARRRDGLERDLPSSR